MGYNLLFTLLGLLCLEKLVTYSWALEYNFCINSAAVPEHSLNCPPNTFIMIHTAGVYVSPPVISHEIFCHSIVTNEEQDCVVPMITGETLKLRTLCNNKNLCSFNADINTNATDCKNQYRNGQKFYHIEYSCLPKLTFGSTDPIPVLNPCYLPNTDTLIQDYVYLTSPSYPNGWGGVQDCNTICTLKSVQTGVRNILNLTTYDSWVQSTDPSMPVQSCSFYSIWAQTGAQPHTNCMEPLPNKPTSFSTITSEISFSIRQASTNAEMRYLWSLEVSKPAKLSCLPGDKSTSSMSPSTTATTAFKEETTTLPSPTTLKESKTTTTKEDQPKTTITTTTKGDQPKTTSITSPKTTERKNPPKPIEEARNKAQSTVYIISQKWLVIGVILTIAIIIVIIIIVAVIWSITKTKREPQPKENPPPDEPINKEVFYRKKSTDEDSVQPPDYTTMDPDPKLKTRNVTRIEVTDD